MDLRTWLIDVLAAIGLSSSPGPNGLLKVPGFLVMAALSAVFTLASGPLQAAPVASHVRSEIDALLSTMQASRCEFSRNGSWYAAPDAKAHLLKKLDYLEGKNAVQTTEQFIELAAASSSSSGQPYLVKCGTAAPVQSQQWLLMQLKVLRAPPPPK